ncbi:MAG: diguanylate cyclase domain-containing protein [Pseudonocardia sp.]
MVEDFTDQFLLTERLNYQALHDVATGLPNRQYFVSHLEEVLGVLDPSAVITLLHLDLDGFSVINDGLGHHSGDQLLDVVARRLTSVVADQKAMVARLGGDEFGILVQHGVIGAGDPVPNAEGWPRPSTPSSTSRSTSTGSVWRSPPASAWCSAGPVG